MISGERRCSGLYGHFEKCNNINSVQNELKFLVTIENKEDIMPKRGLEPLRANYAH